MRRLLPVGYLWLALILALALLAACAPAAAPAPTAAPAKPAPAPTTAPAAPAAKPAAAPTAAAAPAAPAPTKAAAAPAAVPPLSKQYKLVMPTGGTAGVYYIYGGAIAALWNRSIPNLNVTVETSGGSVENARRIGGGDAEVTILQNDISQYAWDGTEFFKEPMKNFRAVAALFPELLHYPVTTESNVKQLADLKGKRFSIGPPGSGTEANCRQAFEAAGITYNDLGKKVQVSFNEAVAAIKDRQLDGFALTAGPPQGNAAEVATTMDMSFIGLGGATGQKMMDKWKFYVPAKVPANSYKGQTQEIDTVAVLAVLVARQDQDADMVYWMTKTLIEKQPELAQAHAKGKELSKESAIKGWPLEWHPGAVKYYKEIGLMK